MKKTLALIALASVSVLSASGYCPSCSGGGGGGGYYQGQPGSYYDQYQRQQPYQNNGQHYQQYDGQYSGGQQNYQGNGQYDSRQQANNDKYEQGEQKSSADQEISRKIRDALSAGWFSKGSQNVYFDVNNGYVTLRGSVDTAEDKNKVEDAVGKIEGIRQINNQITAIKADTTSSTTSQLQASEKKFPQDFASTPQDRQLNIRIRDALGSGWFSKGYETIIIRTTDGVVVISGTVDKNEDMQKINDRVKGVDGVKIVNNKVTVKNK